MKQKETHYLTQEGADKLQEELKYLINTARVEVSKRLRTAIQQGDLSENADYISAKEEQGFLEGRIQELQQILSNTILIDDLERDITVIGIGDTVLIQEADFPVEEYFIVGPNEADPTNGKISHKSPIGNALLGRKVGDQVIVDTPNGKSQFKILEIK